MSDMEEKSFTFIDLFAGCGGLTEGFYKVGFNALTHVEYDHFACESLRIRMRYHGYPEDKISVLQKDITDKDIIERIEHEINGQKVDLLIGGPPCQSFSTLGRARDENGMRDDPRNFLFEGYEKILRHFRPKIFVFENVTGLMTAKIGKKKIIDLILGRLGRDYRLLSDPNDMILNSCDYGVPQIRKRVILIGVRKDLARSPDKIYNGIIKTHYGPGASDEEKAGRKRFISVEEAISDLPALKPGQGKRICRHRVRKWNDFLSRIRSENDEILCDHVARNHNEDDKKRYHEMSKNRWSFRELLEKKPELNHIRQRVFDNSYVVQFWDLPARTIIAHLYKDGNQFIHPDYRQERTITPREAARLQSFPDDFFFAGSVTQQYKQIGNAVPPLMAEAIAYSVKKAIEDI